MLSILGNILWLVSSFFVPVVYLIGGILLFPLLPFLWPAIKYSFLPFGRELVKNSYLAEFKGGSFSEKDFVSKNFEDTGSVVRFLANIVWPLTLGWIIAGFHLLAVIINVATCFVVIGLFFVIPNTLAHFKLISVAFRPFGRSIVSSELNKRLQSMKTDTELKKITGEE